MQIRRFKQSFRPSQAYKLIPSSDISSLTQTREWRVNPVIDHRDRRYSLRTGLPKLGSAIDVSTDAALGTTPDGSTINPRSPGFGTFQLRPLDRCRAARNVFLEPAPTPCKVTSIIRKQQCLVSGCNTTPTTLFTTIRPSQSLFQRPQC